MRRLFLSTAIFGAFGLAGCMEPDVRQLRSARIDKPAPDFELDGLDGAKVKLSDLRGKPVLLAFFAYS